jgi:hypothetical protein
MPIDKSGKPPTIFFNMTSNSMSRNCRVAFPLSMRVRLKISVTSFASRRPSFMMMFRYFSALLSGGKGKLRHAESNFCKKSPNAASIPRMNLSRSPKRLLRIMPMIMDITRASKDA